MNRIILLIVIILTLDIYLIFGNIYETFRVVSDRMVPLEKPYDQYTCRNETFSWQRRVQYIPIPICLCCIIIIIFFFPIIIPICFVIIVPHYYMGWHYDREWKNKCYNRFNYGYATWDEIQNVLRQRYPRGIPPVSVWSRRELWPNNFYHRPDKIKENCCFLYKDQMNKLTGAPCVKDFEMNTKCDFYANHIYENGSWRAVDRSNGERSECDRVPDIRKICCHTCSL